MKKLNSQKQFLIAIILLLTTTSSFCQNYEAKIIEPQGKAWIEKDINNNAFQIFYTDGKVALVTDINNLVQKPTPKPDELSSKEKYSLSLLFNLDYNQLIKAISNSNIVNASGILKIGQVEKQVLIQWEADPNGSLNNGFNLSLIIHFNPNDFGIKIKDEDSKLNTIFRIDDAYVKRQQ